LRERDELPVAELHRRPELLGVDRAPRLKPRITASRTVRALAESLNYALRSKAYQISTLAILVM
jgi:hypothetical protein